MPKVSIIIPVYNKENELDRCFSSVLAQSYRDLEIIVINDGSTDNSLSVCRNWADKDKRIRVFDQKNQGVAATRSLGLEKSEGEYIGFVDPDDCVEPDWLEEVFSQQKADLYIWGYYRDTYSEKSVNPETQRITPQKQGVTLMRNQPKDIVELQTCILYPLWNKLFRREVILTNQLFFEPISCWEDACFVCDYLRAAQSVCIIDDCYYHYCVIKGKESLSNLRYSPNKCNQYFTLHNHFKQLCSFYDECGSSARANDLRLIHNAAGDIIYNLNSAYCKLSKADKLKYIQKVLSDDEMKNALKATRASEIKLIDMRIFYFAMKKSVKSAYNAGIILNRIRRIKKRILG